MEIYHWIVAFSIVLPIMWVILSIPTFISIFKIGGFRKYLNNIKILFLLGNNMDKSYHYENNKVIQFTYPDGTKTRTINSMEFIYFLPIYVSNSQFYLLTKKDSQLYNRFDVTKYAKVNNSWIPEDLKIQNLECLYTMILYNRFNKKVKFSNDKSVRMFDLDSIEKIINSDIRQKNRNDKLNSILNERYSNN